ncbi:MAG TPA: hypothetical protein VGE38_02445 [Nocardioides sp.]|uniref:hypothetical protein n=1 Tax=Nocardioides sp. TaxID=35761 RepID=UPI002EDA2DAC
MTNSPSDDELRHRLRVADPAATLSPADPDRVAALVERAVTNDVRATGHRGRNPLTWLVAAAAVVLLALIAGYAVFGTDDPVPSAGDEPTGAPSEPGPATVALTTPQESGRCMVPSADVLAVQELAFEATAIGIADGVVTLEPERFYAGQATDEVTVTVPDDTALLQPELEFAAGTTYLIAATGDVITGCGLSGPATPELRALYAEAFGA